MFPVDRQVGVRIPNEQLAPQASGSPNTVLHAVPAQMVAVQFMDEFGRAHNSVLLRVGADVYHAPNGEQWAAALRPAAGWLREKVLKSLDSEKEPIPAQDTVDVVGAQLTLPNV